MAVSPLAERLRQRFYGQRPHPYATFERRVDALLRPDKTLLDAGCGRTAPILKKYQGKAQRLIGVELVEFTEQVPGMELHNADLAHIPLPDASVDVVMSRSVFEHLTDPDAVYAELSRIVKPGGHVVFLTASLWDYGTMVARMVPNRWHSKVVLATEGRPEEDTFPTAYKTNDRKRVSQLAAAHGFAVQSFEYLNQYPNYFLFSAPLFLLGTLYERLTSRFEFLAPLRGWILVTLQRRV